MYYDIYQLISEEEALRINGILTKLEWHEGKARTEALTGTIKRNLEIKEIHSPEAKLMLLGLNQAVSNSEIKVDHFIKKNSGFKFNQYTETGEYRRHGDAPFMGNNIRTDLSATLSLSDPNLYEGGDLCIEESSGDFVTIRLNPGQIIVYPCHMPHWVTPVTKGSRISAITWFESMFRDVEQRSLVRRFHRVLKQIENNLGKDEEVFTSLTTIHSRLIRMWAEHI